MSRPSRSRMQRVDTIARYWLSDAAPLQVFARDISFDRPECFRCAVPATEWMSNFERAHLIDRALHGLDHAGNVVPLCPECHDAMPSFDDWDDAIEWVAYTRIMRQWDAIVSAA
jgi:5-methylcytosine-specific restriction endonuclease McrA